MPERQPIHRLFGLCWTDFCEGSALNVKPEKDLSVKQQFLDLLLTRQGPGPLPSPLPDGFDDMSDHNVITFKSHREPLDFWALKELMSHYVNTRKQCSTVQSDLLSEDLFRLYAICVSFPHNMAQQLAMTPVSTGVYEITVLQQRIRIIVVQELPEAEQNALLLLFSAREKQVKYAREHYQPRTTEMTTLFSSLFKTYSEDPTMSDALKEYARTAMKEILKDIPPEERMEGIPYDKRMEGIPTEKRVEGLPPEEMRKLYEALQQRFQANESETDS